MTDVPKVVQATPNIFQRTVKRAQSYRVLGSFVQASRAFGQDRCSLIAAALSYYTLLSIFPLLLFLVALASFILQSENALRVVTNFVSEFLPQSPALIRSNLQEVIRLRGSITFIAAAGFVWSASGVFTNVQLGLNRVFRIAPRPNLARIPGLDSDGCWGWSAVCDQLCNHDLLPFHPSFSSTAERWGVEIISTIIAIILATIVFAALYRFVPYDPTIRWRHVSFSAFIAAVSWEGAKIGFVWYLTNVNQLNLIYGSIGAVIALMLWGYVTWVIVLYCAEVAAAHMGVHEREVTGKEWWAVIAR
jgi:membrane protein